ncbi:MAG: hypothetical protein WA906_01990 [Pacificimonas sp.]
MIYNTLITKINRARFHYTCLLHGFHVWCDGDPVRYETRETGLDAGYRKIVTSLHFNGNPPVEWNIIVGDLLQQLRSVFEHISFNANHGAMLSKSKQKSLNFPILPEENEENYNKKILSNKLFTPKFIDFANRLRPYLDGNTPLCHLHKLAVIDRHRNVSTTCAGVFSKKWGMKVGNDGRPFDGYDPARAFSFIPHTDHLPSQPRPIVDGEDVAYEIVPRGKESLFSVHVETSLMLNEPDVCSPLPAAMALANYIQITEDAVVLAKKMRIIS